ncbi:isoaspartyl peptidase/L-asparaginase family protein [Arenibaculum pallidiluteum]|uniref:isoaspartyl peptidase/L-asparaginase family protein n=1 Tax=Arenibaculum pallidiluteum TaxID=2812559 RepID=UPI001A97BE47|nr:isoaspartyl peptidase/L-asparaginase family protein [Arenibaculum pallidiluteum]
MTGRWAIVVHGGAKSIDPAQAEANRCGCLAAVAAGQAVLEAGGAAVDAVEAAIRVLEDDPTFNAGRGSVRNAAGDVEMDAALMDGQTLDLGGVAAIRGVRHPITVARLMLREDPVLLVADGARTFAAERGAERCDPPAPMLPGNGAGRGGAGRDTVGCVALDLQGHLAAGTSTGGLEGCAVGRVGDSPLPGCGLYAEDGVGAVSFSGDGEAIARTMLASRVVRGLEGGDPDSAVERALVRLVSLGADGGAIALDGAGRIGWNHNSRNFAVGYVVSGAGDARAFLAKAEEREIGQDAG